MAENVGGVYYEVDADTSKLMGQTRVVERETGKMGFAFNKMAGAIAAAISAIAIEGMVSKVITAQRQFDVMFASLKTVTGGVDKAGAAFERLRKFAAQTPFTLDQSVNGFVKLVALGLDPSERAMTSFGNTASAMGKSLTQMIEAVADASTGEFERLKEFGIKAKQQGDRVSLTFQGVTTTIGNNSAEITEYLTKIGEVNFAGAMSERMKTLDGDISNLEDSLAALYLTISQSGFGDAVAAGVRKASEAISELTTSVREGGLTEYFDALKPVIAAAEVAVVTLAGAIAGRLVLAFVAAARVAYAAATAMGAATIAARGFTAVLTLMGGPIGIAVTGLALLALNWDKVAGSARSAATISEQAAERIAAAMKRSPARATADLRFQLAGVNEELALIDKELGRSGELLEDDKIGLNARRDALVKAANDIRAAMDKLHGGAGRGRVNPENVIPRAEGGSDVSGAKKKRGAPVPIGYGILDAKEDSKQRFLQAEKDYEATDRLMTATEERAAEHARRLQETLAADVARGQGLAQSILGQGDEVLRLQLELETKSELLAQAAARDQENLELYAAARVSLEQQTQEQIAAIIARRNADSLAGQSQLLQGYGSLFGNMAEITRTFAGEQSGAYKAMFAVSKAFAIADSIIKIQQGIAGAAAAGATWQDKLIGMSTVAAATANILSTIKGANFAGGRQYGGPVDAGSLYRVNEGGRPEMFTAANGSQYMMPNQRGEVVPSGGGGSTVLELRIINQAPGVSVSQRTGGDGKPEVIIAEIAGQISERRGPVWGALKTTNVQGRL